MCTWYHPTALTLTFMKAGSTDKKEPDSRAAALGHEVCEGSMVVSPSNLSF